MVTARSPCAVCTATELWFGTETGWAADKDALASAVPARNRIRMDNPPLTNQGTVVTLSPLLLNERRETAAIRPPEQPRRRPRPGARCATGGVDGAALPRRAR